MPLSVKSNPTSASLASPTLKAASVAPTRSRTRKVGAEVDAMVVEASAEKLIPSSRQLAAARAGKVIPGERFGLVKSALGKLWANKFTIVGSAVVGGGAVAAALLHSAWLPQALHLATSPVGLGVLAGVAGLALIGGTAYLVRNMVTTVRHAQVDRARNIARGEKQAAKGQSAQPAVFRSVSLPTDLAAKAGGGAGAKSQVAEKASADSPFALQEQSMKEALAAHLHEKSRAKGTASEPVVTRRSIGALSTASSASERFVDSTARQPSADSLDRVIGDEKRHGPLFDGSPIVRGL